MKKNLLAYLTVILGTSLAYAGNNDVTFQCVEENGSHLIYSFKYNSAKSEVSVEGNSTTMPQYYTGTNPSKPGEITSDIFSKFEAVVSDVTCISNTTDLGTLFECNSNGNKVKHNLRFSNPNNSAVLLKEELLPVDVRTQVRASSYYGAGKIQSNKTAGLTSLYLALRVSVASNESSEQVCVIK